MWWHCLHAYLLAAGASCHPSSQHVHIVLTCETMHLFACFECFITNDTKQIWRSIHIMASRHSCIYVLDVGPIAGHCNTFEDVFKKYIQKCILHYTSVYRYDGWKCHTTIFVSEYFPCLEKGYRYQENWSIVGSSWTHTPVAGHTHTVYTNN